MPILGIVNSSVTGSNLDTGAMFPLQVVTVGAAGATDVTFTNIPTTGYAHLQLRAIARSTNTNTGIDNVFMQINSDTGNNYARHNLIGNGTTASATAASSTSFLVIGLITRQGSSSSIFGGFVTDILDYANTNKNKTIRSLMGNDLNGSGEVRLSSGLWTNTSAITSIKIYSENNNLGQYSQFALYGVKSA